MSVAACGGANQYGYGREYVPLSDEEPYYEKAEQVSYEEVRRDPAAYGDKIIGWFGTVTDVLMDDSGNVSLIMMQLRFHQNRHLCSDQFDSSCRVTISQREGGPFSAKLVLSPDDQIGKNRVYKGSLLKVYGFPTGDFDEQGGPIIQAQYYRHWPRNTYVTTTAQRTMRR